MICLLIGQFHAESSDYILFFKALVLIFPNLFVRDIGVFINMPFDSFHCCVDCMLKLVLINLVS